MSVSVYVALALLVCGLALQAEAKGGGSSGGKGGGSGSKGGGTNTQDQDNDENEQENQRLNKAIEIITSAGNNPQPKTLEEVQAEKARTHRRLMELEAQEAALTASRERSAETSSVTVGVTNSADWDKKFFGDDYPDHDATRCACIAYGDNGAFCMGWECRDKKACFPGDSKVELGNGTKADIGLLREGDVVRGSIGWTRVTIISHQVAPADDNTWFNMEVEVEEGGRRVASRASPDHHVFVVHEGVRMPPQLTCGAHVLDTNTFTTKPMSRVAVGDRVCTAFGLAKVVSHQPAEGKKLLIAPHTMDGTIQVDNTVYSCYSHPTLPHRHSHTLFNTFLDPLRKTLLPYRDDGKNPHAARIEGMAQQLFSF